MRFLQPKLHPTVLVPLRPPSGVTRSVLPHFDSLVHHTDNTGDHPSLRADDDPSSSWISHRLSVSWIERTRLAWQGVSLYE
jgi:hypothetical protein